jgi:protein SCO1/2
MLRKYRLRIAVIAALLVAASSVIVRGPSPAAAFDNARWGKDYFPNVPLTTQDGVTVHFYDDLIKGKIVAIDLIYTHCVDSCPLETARLAQVQKMLGDRVGKDIFFYSISIDPDNDTPAELKAYAEKYHAGPGWLFLTGKKEDVELISKKIGLYSAPNPRNRDGHTPALLLGNEATGQWMRNAALDNPRFLAIMIGDFLNSWKNRKPAGSQPNYANAPPLSVDHGQYVFASHCAACHTVGRGDFIGPDLKGVTEARETAWLRRFIATPDKMLSERDPLTVSLFAKYKKVIMPNLRLADVDVEAVIGYLRNQSAAVPATGATPGKAGEMSSLK